MNTNNQIKLASSVFCTVLLVLLQWTAELFQYPNGVEGGAGVAFAQSNAKQKSSIKSTPKAKRQTIKAKADIANLIGKSEAQVRKGLSRFKFVGSSRIPDDAYDEPGGKFLDFAIGKNTDGLDEIVATFPRGGKCSMIMVNYNGNPTKIPLSNAPELLAKWGMVALPPPYQKAPIATYWRIERNGLRLEVRVVSGNDGIWQIHITPVK